MPAAFERCLDHVRGKVANPYAVCTKVNAGGIKQYRKKEMRRKRVRAGRAMKL